jgi:conjugal transfer pilus assembly protein TraF
VTPQENHSFWERKSEGWFFYAEPDEPEEIKPVEAPPPKQRQTVTKATPPPKAAPAPAGEPPQAFSAAWFRENLPKYRDAAWDNPTVENVQAFMYLQRFAMDRSQQFAEASEVAVMGNPFLDETVRRPAATYAAQALDKQAGQAKQELLNQLSTSAGLFYFYASDCQMCATQVQVMRVMENRFVVTPISVDGKHMPGTPYPNMKKDAGHAAKLGVTHLPAIYLVSADGQFVPIGQGALGIGELEDRILLAAKGMGWVSEDEHDLTRPVRNTNDDLSTMVSLPTTPSDGYEDGFIPPEELLRHIERSISGK